MSGRTTICAACSPPPSARTLGRQLAEVAGRTTPYGLQHLLARANWDADLVRDDLRGYVTEHLGGENENAVLVVDETGFIKKGTNSVGVKRQYTGTAGKTENCQVGVFLAYASRRGQAFVDRELYLPEEWAKDEERRKQAGVPEEIGMRTKPELAREMLGRALDGGVKAAWVVADSVYADTRRLGMFLEGREQPYVLALSGKAHVSASELNERQPVLGLLRPARAEAPPLAQPRDRALHHPPPRRMNLRVVRGADVRWTLPSRTPDAFAPPGVDLDVDGVAFGGDELPDVRGRRRRLCRRTCAAACGLARPDA